MECGHSICGHCIKVIFVTKYRCPFDSKELKIPPGELNPNYDLIDSISLLAKTPKFDSVNYALLLIIIFLILILAYF